MPLHNFGSICLPYCLQQNPDGSWLVLNREYKPIGFNQRHQQYRYEDYDISTKFNGLGPNVQTKLAWNGLVEDGRFFLYNDSCDPTHSAVNMKRYLDKLKLLAKLEVAKS